MAEAGTFKILSWCVSVNTRKLLEVRQEIACVNTYVRTSDLGIDLLISLKDGEMVSCSKDVTAKLHC